MGWSREYKREGRPGRLGDILSSRAHAAIRNAADGKARSQQAKARRVRERERARARERVRKQSSGANVSPPNRATALVGSRLPGPPPQGASTGTARALEPPAIEGWSDSGRRCQHTETSDGAASRRAASGRNLERERWIRCEARARAMTPRRASAASDLRGRRRRACIHTRDCTFKARGRAALNERGGCRRALTMSRRVATV